MTLQHILPNFFAGSEISFEHKGEAKRPIFEKTPVAGAWSEFPTPNNLDFDLPVGLEASEPPEARGLARDEVRLMVSYRADNRIVHTQFRDITQYLQAGDLLVIN